MIWNMLLMLLTIGWTINAGTFGGRREYTAQFCNAALAIIVGLILVYRLS